MGGGDAGGLKFQRGGCRVVYGGIVLLSRFFVIVVLPLILRASGCGGQCRSREGK